MGGIVNTALSVLPQVLPYVASPAGSEQRAREQAERMEAENRLREAEQRLRDEELRRREAELERQRQLLVFEQGQEAERRDLADRQRLDGAAQDAERAGRLAEFDAAAGAAEAERRAALERGLARTRASMAARGVGTADGSGRAVLLGLEEESEADRARGAEQDRLRRQDLDRQAEDVRRRNLLEVSQLAERQRLDRIARGYK
jgi:colicin import membrane protein